MSLAMRRTSMCVSRDVLGDEIDRLEMVVEGFLQVRFGSQGQQVAPLVFGSSPYDSGDGFVLRDVLGEQQRLRSDRRCRPPVGPRVSWYKAIARFKAVGGLECSPTRRADRPISDGYSACSQKAFASCGFERPGLFQVRQALRVTLFMIAARLAGDTARP